MSQRRVLQRKCRPELELIREDLALCYPMPRARRAYPVHVIPRKAGDWRTVVMSPRRYRWWRRAWRAWYRAKGCRLERSPEMWQE